MDRTVLPFYYPTITFLLDDDINFLRHFTLLLDSGTPCRTCNSAVTALQYINGQISFAARFNEFTKVVLLDDIDERIYMDLNKLHKLIYNDNRFSNISVVIVDYDMPEMNGLEFCKQITNPEIKKILLTGKADEKVAVDAFNQGLINRYIKKSIANVDIQINQAIKNLQHEYFTDITRPVYITMTENGTSFLVDRQFINNFSGIIKDNNYIEYYLHDNPKGMLLVDAEGKSGFLFIVPEETLNSHMEIAGSCDAPRELLKLLIEGKHVPWFPTKDSFYTRNCKSGWKKHVYPVDFFCGNDIKYICSYVCPAPPELMDLSGISPYQAYLKKFNQVKNLKNSGIFYS